MRIVGGIVLVIVAMAAGLFGALMLGVSGLSWAGPGLTVIPYSDSDDGERAIGIGMGVVALGAWVLLTSAGFFVARGRKRTRPSRVVAGILVVVSVVVVLGATIFATSTPPPVIENPPPWNRA
ncbi:MAG: hypothetical protein K0R81_1804 [Microbacterium sp.]|nr:hypothetical protein [Microbacterium sp.]